MPALILTALTLSWAYAVVMGGGVWPRDWYGCLGVVGAGGLVYFALTRRSDLAPALPPNRRWALLALAMAAGMQLVPLPLGVVRAIAGHRAALDEALGLTGAQTGYTTLSVAPAATWEWSITLLGLIVTYLLVRELTHRYEARPWVLAAPLIAVGTLEALLGLLQAALGSTARMEGSTGSYANRNHFAGLLEMCLPLAVMGAVGLLAKGNAFTRQRTKVGPALAAGGLLAAAGVMLLAVVASLSRMGFISALGGLAVMGSLALARGQRGARRWLPAAVMILAGMAAFVLLPTDQLVTRFADISGGEEVAANTRTQIWGDTLRLIRAYPLTGCGLGAYEPALLPFKTVAPLNTVDYAHNDYLQLLAELGIFGFVPLIFVTGVAYGRAVRHAMRLRRSPAAYLALATAGGLTAMAIHSLADFNLYIPANAMAAVWLGGLADHA